MAVISLYLVQLDYSGQLLSSYNIAAAGSWILCVISTWESKYFLVHIQMLFSGTHVLMVVCSLVSGIIICSHSAQLLLAASTLGKISICRPLPPYSPQVRYEPKKPSFPPVVRAVVQVGA